MLLIFFSNSYSQLLVSGSGPPDYHFKINDKDFFPIGWYNVARVSDLQQIKKYGVNVVLNYWNNIWENYGPVAKSYDKNQYLIALQEYLTILDSLDLKAIIPLGIEQYGKYGFSTSSIIDIVTRVKDHPAVFAWYLYDEPYSHSLLNDDQHPSSTFLKDIADRIRKVDRNHPLIPVIVDPRFFSDYNNPDQIYKRKDGTPAQIPLPIDPSVYDAIGWDNYVFKKSMDENVHPWNDYNNISRVTTKRGVEQIKKNKKMGFIFVGMAHDRYPGNRELSIMDVKYETLSPVIHGARGLLYYWWSDKETSPAARKNVNKLIGYFTHFKLGTILLKGENVTDQVKINEIFINGEEKKYYEYNWENYNNGDASVYPEFTLFNYIARRYENSIYLFAVNEFRPTIKVEFDLGGIKQLIVQIVELKIDLMEIPLYNFLFAGRDQVDLFWESFDSYAVKVYRLDLYFD